MSNFEGSTLIIRWHVLVFLTKNNYLCIKVTFAYSICIFVGMWKNGNSTHFWMLLGYIITIKDISFQALNFQCMQLISLILCKQFFFGIFQDLNLSFIHRINNLKTNNKNFGLLRGLVWIKSMLVQKSKPQIKVHMTMRKMQKLLFLLAHGIKLYSTLVVANSCNLIRLLYLVGHFVFLWVWG